MKKFSLLALAAAGLLLGACSDKNEVVQENPVNPNEFENGAYIGISLSMPSADNNITRANDELSNGIEAEFAVKNATLYIFKGTSEANAVYVDYVSLGTKYNPDTQGGIATDEWGEQDDVDDTNITSTSLNEATKIPNDLAATIKADNTNTYYAYVILNHNGQIPTLYDGTDGEHSATTFQAFSRTKFTEIGADIALEQNIWADGMLMTNAPICNVAGGTAAPSSPTYSTLVPIDKSKIFSSVAQAKQEPAACVYVERAAVKITVAQGSGVSTSTIDGYKVAVSGWKVINTERSYYNTRQINFKSTEAVESSNTVWPNIPTTTWTAEDWGGYTNANATPANAKYRFVSYYQFLPTLPTGVINGYDNNDPPQEIPYTHTVGYRTYFAADPNYNVDAKAAMAASGSDPAVPSTLNFTTADDDDVRPWIDPNKHAYTTENTFDVKHQTWRNTTMVTVKTQLTDATDNTKHPNFYTVGKGGQTMYTETTDVQAVLHNIIMNDPTVSGAVQTLLNEYATNYPSDNIKAGLTITLNPVSDAITGVGFSWAIAFTKNGSALSPQADGTTGHPAETTKNTALNTAITNFVHPTGDANKYADAVLVSYYKNGLMYYNVKIQHFGEFETPWNGTPGTGDVVANGTGVDVKEIYFKTLHNATSVAESNYNEGQSKFLGRYGVVRDNWYKLEINGVTKIGSATPEDPSLTKPDTPDDEIENYISVHVHIVPWVLRSQSVTL